jgi:hypothetical protein
MHAGRRSVPAATACRRRSVMVAGRPDVLRVEDLRISIAIERSGSRW